MEEKRYFIYAYEGRYSGLHGIYDYCFYECTFQDAEAYGYEMYYNVIESYSFILDELYDEDSTDEEMNEAKMAIGILGGKIKDDIVFDLVENMPRRIILIKKNSQTPTKYPRPSAQIAKKPLK